MEKCKERDFNLSLPVRQGSTDDDSILQSTISFIPFDLFSSDLHLKELTHGHLFGGLVSCIVIRDDLDYMVPV